MENLSLAYLIRSDLYRIHGSIGLKEMIRELLFGEAFRYNFWLRIGHFLRQNRLMKYTLYPWVWLILRRLSIQLGSSIPAGTQIGSGLYIGHFSGIFVNGRCVIGKNCNLSHGVTLGQANRGPNKGYPTLGDNIYLGPGAKVVGAVRIGNDVAIGANCVVTKDVPDHAVVVGIPGRVISSKGTIDYVTQTDYDHLLASTGQSAIPMH